MRLFSKVVLCLLVMGLIIGCSNDTSDKQKTSAAKGTADTWLITHISHKERGKIPIHWAFPRGTDGFLVIDDANKIFYLGIGYFDPDNPEASFLFKPIHRYDIKKISRTNKKIEITFPWKQNFIIDLESGQAKGFDLGFDCIRLNSDLRFKDNSYLQSPEGKKELESQQAKRAARLVAEAKSKGLPSDKAEFLKFMNGTWKAAETEAELDNVNSELPIVKFNVDGVWDGDPYAERNDVKPSKIRYIKTVRYIGENGFEIQAKLLNDKSTGLVVKMFVIISKNRCAFWHDDKTPSFYMERIE